MIMRKPPITAFKKEFPGTTCRITPALKARFEKNMNRHIGLEWAKVQAKLEANTEKLWSVNEMERPAANPMLLVTIKRQANILFYDCSAESLKTRSVMLAPRKVWNQGKNINRNNAIDMAAAMGIEILTEEQYRELQKLGNFDTKTSSCEDAAEIRKLAGALFCDRRYDHVFVYHNSADLTIGSGGSVASFGSKSGL